MSAVWAPEPRERPTQESVTSAAHLPQPPNKILQVTETRTEIISLRTHGYLNFLALIKCFYQSGNT